MKGPRGPFQTSITINVQNLVVTSPDETKMLKWDPVRGIADTSFSYSLECAQRKWCQVKVSIYSTDGTKVYEEWLEKLAPGSYSFTWDGSVNVVPPPPPPDGLAPAGLYVFDIDVIGIAPGYDEDWLRSRALRIGEHQVYLLATPWQRQPSYQAPSYHIVRDEYLLHDSVPASAFIIEVYDPDFLKIASANGTTKTIPEWMTPQLEDWNIIEFPCFFSKSTYFIPYIFVHWAWDGHINSYKNHKSKITFNNQKLGFLSDDYYCINNMCGNPIGSFNWFFRNTIGFLQFFNQLVGNRDSSKGINWRWNIPQTAHFYIEDAVRGGYNGHNKANSELVEVQCRTITYGPRVIVHVTTYAREWRWSKFFPPEPNVQPWNKIKILRAINSVDVLSIAGHGDAIEPDGESGTRMGPFKKKSSKEDLTTDDISNLNLSHLRLVFLAGCFTGGIVGLGDDAVRWPEPTSLAGRFRQANVQSVIFTGDEVSWRALDKFADKFWALVTKVNNWRLPSPQTAGHHPINVQSAVQRAKLELLLSYKDGLSRKYILAIFMDGDAQLAH